ncbi:MAG: hypothetical protein WA957_03030 [Alteraurantiacibacter sp.]
MYIGRTTLLFALAAGIGGCSGDPSEDDSQAASTVPEALSSSPVADGAIGPVSYSYDTSELARAEISLPLPPAFEETKFAVKFLPRDLVDKLGEERCSYEEANDNHECTAEQEIGFALAFLDRPVEYYGEQLIDHLDENMRVEGIEVQGRAGFALYTARNGTKLRYTFLPVDSRTLMMVERKKETIASGAQALEQVRESLVFPDD